MNINFVGFQNFPKRYQTRIRKIAYQWLSDHLEVIEEYDRNRVLNELNKFKIEVMPTTFKSKLYPDRWHRTDMNTSDMIPWEIMGQYQLQLFLIDRKDDLFLASNIMAMTHGLGHVLLYSYDKHRRFKLTVDDASGNKKGDEVNWFTAAVHNRTEAIDKVVQKAGEPDLENQIYYLQTYRNWDTIWRKQMYRTYDFRDDLD
jgi:hypothetical protein